MSGSYDIAIIGAGVAGLALARALAQTGLRSSVIVLEPRRIAPNPRRWVFPARPGHALSRFETARLGAFSAVRPSGAVEQRPLRRSVLAHVPAADVQSASLDAIANQPGWVLEDRVRIDAHGRDGRLDTSLGVLRASRIIDTRPVAGGAVAASAWTQIVHAAWLDGAGSGRTGLSFTAAERREDGVELYQILDLPEGRWLELVRFAPPGDAGATAAERLRHTVDRFGGFVGATRPVRAVLPLSPAKPPASRTLVPAAAGGEGLRFGPGTAALALTEWAETQAMRIVQGQSLIPPRSRPAARTAARWLDARFRRDPGLAADQLNRLLHAADPDGVLRLLAGAPRWRDLALLAHSAVGARAA